MASSSHHYLDFERPIADLEAKIEEISKLSETAGTGDVESQLDGLRATVEQKRREIYSGLDPWRKTQVARHPERPHFADYVTALVDEFVELRGDRKYGDDQAIVGGLGRFRGMPVVVMGHEKGHDTTTRLKHNFGMARPEGYRKAVRLMDMAEQFDLPVISFVDTAGAYPGIGAEERGQSEAIAKSTERCLTLGVPMVCTITGEGGSGGAIALAAGNRVLILEHSIYSVISPEGAASILWRDTARAQDAATGMKITAQDLLKFGIIDRIVQEPTGGAHRDGQAAINRAGDAIAAALGDLAGLSGEDVVAQRADKFLAIGRNL
jgi:acetyl-CoA carboxylase carboxyl transferase subunit alpha